MREANRAGEDQQREELHRQIFENNRAVQLLIDTDSGRIVEANHAACRFYGYSREQLTSLRISDINASSAEQTAWERALAAAQRRDYFLFRHRLSSGEVREVEVRSGPVDIGERRLLYSVVHDVTERRKAEEALRQSEEKYRAVLESIEEGYYEVDLSGNLTFFNDALCRMLGYERHEVRGLNHRRYVDARNARRLRHEFGLVYSTGKPAKYPEIEVVTKAGERRYVRLSVSLIRDAAGAPVGFRGVVRDITASREAEEALRQSHQFTQQIISNARDGIIVYDCSLRYVLWNPVMEELTGVPASQVLGQSAAELFPHLRERGVLPLLEAALAGATLSSPDIPYHVPQTGRSGWASSTYGPHRDGDGQIVGVIAIVRDVTERKRAEEALRQSEARFRTLAESAPCGILIYQGSRFRYVNPAAAAITGYSREELEGMSAWEIVHPDFHAPVRERFSSRQSGAKAPSRYELKIVRKDGAERWLDYHYAGSVEFGGEPTAMGTAFDITDRKQAEEQIKNLAYHDALTGLPNRLVFNDRLSVAVAQAHRTHQPLAVLFLDLDRFKLINDSLGHSLGDLLLQAVAARLLDCVREGDTVARVGGDEFILLLPGIARAVDTAKVAEKILDTVREPFTVEGRELFITASAGISLFPEDGQDAETLVKNADTAMYRAKDQGRDNYQLYTSTMNARALERLGLENSLRKALSQGELVVYYQPLLDMTSGEIHGVEALLRWRHPEKGLILPADFIPLAEITGLIVPISPWVLWTACAQVKAWHDRGFPNISVAVNLSARQFQQADLVELVTRALEETELPPHCLDLEITENHAMQSAESVIHTLRELKGLGVRISIDDFGIGYSSLGYLKRLPIDTLKIDQSFVRDITTDPDDAAIATAVIVMAHTLKLKVVAEGVETEEQLKFLTERRCDRMQGFLFGRPMPAEQLEAFLQRSLTRTSRVR